MLRITLSILILVVISNNTNAQDTINVLHYNLLNYGLPVYGCNATNNNTDDKDGYLKTIIEYTNPDIFTVNEMRYESYDSSYVDRIMDSVLNKESEINFKRANITNLANSHIINMLYYNTRKFKLHSQDVIAAYRDINVYTLFYNSEDLNIEEDTVFITCFVVHLKSSQGEDNEAMRADMTEKIMNYISDNSLVENVLLMGDFNIYSDQEEAFQNLVNPENDDLRFNDPIDEIGVWHANEDYKHVHTQSTHTSYNDCAASGGMDDRFDFVLFNNGILNYTHNLGYVNSSYKAIGNDGTCFDQSLLDCTNSDLSDDLVNALYNMSDHLPVFLKFYTDKSFNAVFENNSLGKFKVSIKNPASEVMEINCNIERYTVQIFSILGSVVNEVNSNSSQITIPINNLENGIYFITINSPGKDIYTQKVIINN